MNLAGQTVLVTGGSKGIGRAICLALAMEGANIIIASRNESKIKAIVDKLKKMGCKALAIQADVRNEEDVRHLISRTVDEYGRLDILINNAGVANKKRLEEKLWRNTTRSWLSLIHISEPTRRTPISYAVFC